MSYRLEELVDKKVKVLAMDFQQEGPSLKDRLKAKLQKGYYEWSEKNQAWALCRWIIGVLREDKESESNMRGFLTPALWFHPEPRQSVQYKIRITQDSLDENPSLIELVDKIKLLTRFQILKRND